MPDFTAADIAEARRLNARLDKLPRFRMQTTAGRVGWNLGLRTAELFRGRAVSSSDVRLETRTVDWLGRKIELRIFSPTGTARAIVLHLHGGGWTVGNARMNDRSNGELARAGFVVISVDYRLAIHAPISESIDDCEAAALWLISVGAREFGNLPVVILGESAGSHLGAAMLLRLRDKNQGIDRIRGVVLYFGLYDFNGTEMVRQAGPDTLILHAPTIRSVLRKLSPGLNDAERSASELSPVTKDLRGLPPALFIVGDRDVLLEDSRLMHARWDEANGNAELLIAPESPHALNRFRTAIRRKVDAHVRAWLSRRAGGQAED